MTEYELGMLETTINKLANQVYELKQEIERKNAEIEKSAKNNEFLDSENTQLKADIEALKENGILSNQKELENLLNADKRNEKVLRYLKHQIVEHEKLANYYEKENKLFDVLKIQKEIKVYREMVELLKKA